MLAFIIVAVTLGMLLAELWHVYQEAERDYRLAEAEKKQGIT